MAPRQRCGVLGCSPSAELGWEHSGLGWGLSFLPSFLPLFPVSSSQWSQCCFLKCHFSAFRFHLREREWDSLKELIKGGGDSAQGCAHLLCPCTVAEQCCTELGTCMLLHMEHLTLGWVLLLSTWTGASAVSIKNWLIKEVAMDMAPNSFDDQYQGCRRLMEAELPELNRTELANGDFAKGWRFAIKEWQKRWGHATSPPPLCCDQGMALLAYTTEADLYKLFNRATREGGRSRQHYLSSYPFKTLHFLLSRALHTLRESQPQQCYNVYRGVKGTRFTAQQGQVVRFGQFTSTSLKEKVAKKFGSDTFFFVNTCYGVPIKDFSTYSGESEVLIPPAEQFEVTDVTNIDNGNFIHLHSRGMYSTYNCEFVKGRSSPTEPPHLWLILLAVAALAALGEP
ncbi:erythroblast NAD(P)(+)--arginine ADP-ribosyltransferase-like isoform X2 [Meleagris gallopavo]|uniref:erythroblast NAD(P)(+)--arginine ADP-ribosyltransferase-like isoform X2 n=1 Tax=Meleagris gallopavo TaxID=9103 RepID=UPI00093C88A9|nr:erythroblast NAD(P)(+)--arginine ADP-ribosyltransferase-like isoform X2 [Meleagris gallopavo]